MSEIESAISIIIITRDTKELLEQLLHSLNKDIPLKPFIKEVIVVDNGSIDGTGAMIQEKFPQCMSIRNDRNIGFAAAVNKGLLHSTGEFVFLLNSDTRLIEGEVSKMVNFMVENADTGICGPQLLYPDMKLQRSFAYVPSLLFEIIPKSFLEFMFPKKYSEKDFKSEIGNCYDVPSLIGAAIMVRREILQQLKGFDERFFFFLEETDLCVRVRSVGHRVIFFPDARVIHLQGKTVGKNWVRGRIEYNISLHKFIRKHRSGFYFAFFTFIRLIKCLIFLTFFAILPFLLFKKSLLRAYDYYVQLFLWHLKGCPDNGGLKENVSRES